MSLSRMDSLNRQENKHFHHSRFKESKEECNDIISCAVRSCLMAVAIAKTQLHGGFLGDSGVNRKKVYF